MSLIYNYTGLEQGQLGHPFSAQLARTNKGMFDPAAPATSNIGPGDVVFRRPGADTKTYVGINDSLGVDLSDVQTEINAGSGNIAGFAIDNTISIRHQYPIGNIPPSKEAVYSPGKALSVVVSGDLWVRAGAENNGLEEGSQVYVITGATDTSEIGSVTDKSSGLAAGTTVVEMPEWKFIGRTSTDIDGETAITAVERL